MGLNIFSIGLTIPIYSSIGLQAVKRPTLRETLAYTVPKEINFPRYNMKCSGENIILRGIFHVVSCFPLHFMLYRGNLDCFSHSVYISCCKLKVFKILTEGVPFLSFKMSIIPKKSLVQDSNAMQI